jgi:hypothetical protein
LLNDLSISNRVTRLVANETQTETPSHASNSANQKMISVIEGEVSFPVSAQEDAAHNQDAVSYLLEFDRRSSLVPDGVMSLSLSLHGKKSLNLQFAHDVSYDGIMAMNNDSHTTRDKKAEASTAGCNLQHPLTPLIFSRSSVNSLSYRFTREEADSETDDDRAATQRETKDDDEWQCQFRIRPLSNYLKCIVQREFDLILKVQLDEGTYNKGYFPRASLKQPESEDKNKRALYFWRPKRVTGYKNMGDVITTVCRPPVGAVLVHNDYCRQIKKYWRVFTNTKHNYSIWRPIPSRNHVCMGDIISIGRDTKPTLTSCAAIPLWAVSECPLGDWVLCSKKSSSVGMSANVWSVQSQLGFFLGGVRADDDGKMVKALRRVAQRFAALSKSTSAPLVSSLGGYRLKTEVLQVLTGEWRSEIDVIRHRPSLSWTMMLLDLLLDSAETAEMPSLISQLLESDLAILLFHHFMSLHAANDLAPMRAAPAPPALPGSPTPGRVGEPLARCVHCHSCGGIDKIEDASRRGIAWCHAKFDRTGS